MGLPQISENHPIDDVVLRVEEMQGGPPSLGIIVIEEGHVEAEHEDRQQPPRFNAGVETSWNDELLELRSVTLEELEWGQRAVLDVTQRRGPFFDGARAYPSWELRLLLLGKRQRGAGVSQRWALRRMADFLQCKTPPLMRHALHPL
ncbi:hypothetical protein ACLOJK_024321 [Asimina triloba]